MDNPPPNYNPNESVLSGGIDIPIMKVMGGGSLNGYNDTVSLLEGGIEPIVKVEGGGVPDGYNETVSLLDGGIENITRVFGGGNSGPITFVLNYTSADIQKFEAFLNSQTSNITKAISAMTKIKGDLDAKINTLHYVRRNTGVESSSLNSTNANSALQVYIIPKTTHTIIVLPPVSSPEEFFEQIQYLITNAYVSINTKKEFQIKRNIVCISLGINLADDSINYLYLKLKISNMKRFFLVNEPYSLVYVNKLNDKDGIFFTNTDNGESNLYKPLGSDDVGPFDPEIHELELKSIKYKPSADSYTDVYTVSNGPDPIDTTTPDYGFTLSKSIAIIALIDSDFNAINVDLNGILYRIRIPSSSNKEDTVLSLWRKGKFTVDENKLIDDLNLDGIVDIPSFLTTLTYFKCFNDTSLLTKKECLLMKLDLQKLYENKIKS